MNQFGSNFSTVDSASTVSLRSPIIRGESSITASDSAVVCRSTSFTPEGRTGTSDRPFGTVSRVLPRGGRVSQATDPKEMRVSEAGGVVSSVIAIED
ncbi:hypothetical protein Bca52824_018877 [Brassica carinata]|uniref:Uncharacterized protein n=1 Tax=Brassica carinata TaxID=52824 RepID=A0A8X7VQX8_BRACI|nr:hypothetical protein Bca52824_018877 [Brassica carinata]